MSIYAGELMADAGYAISSEPGEDNPVLRTINEAGSWMFGMRSWNWLKSRTAYLGVRKVIEFTDAVYADVGPTLTSDSFKTTAGYTFVTGDTMLLNAGTDVVAGRYTITGQDGTDGDELTLSAQTGAADAATALGGKIDLGFLELPSDLGQIDAIGGVGYTAKVIMASRERLMQLRERNSGAAENYFEASLVYRNVSNVLKPALDIYPDPASTDADRFQIYYGARWANVDEPDDVIVMPAWPMLEALLRQCVRAFARGYEDVEPDQMRLEHRLKEIQRGELYSTCVRQDNAVQRNYGRLKSDRTRRSFYSEYGIGNIDTGTSGISIT